MDSIKKLPKDSNQLYFNSIFDKYGKRPSILESFSLAEFAGFIDIVNKTNLPKDCHEPESEDSNQFDSEDIHSQ